MIRDVRALARGPFNVLVIGGGIYGAWAARDAALRGWSVALVENADWGAGTSSASSKLIHGGLRYLEHFWIGLVRKTLAERELLARLGPHRVRPIRFVLPIDRGGRRGALRLRIGLSLYDALAPRRSAWSSHRRLRPDDVHSLCPFLSSTRTGGGFEFGDAVTDDARFVLETVNGAIRSGAVALNHAGAVELLRAGGRVQGALVEDRLTGDRLEARARVTLVTAGPWVDEQPFRAEREPARLRLTKGVHLLLPSLPGERAVLLTARSDARPIFLIPWLGRTLLGTTDTVYEGRPGGAQVEDSDVDYLLAETHHAFGEIRWSRADIVGSFAGLRALRATDEVDPGSMRRDWSLEEREPGLLLSIGGKLTSARADAAQAIDRVGRLLGRPSCPPPTASLPFAWTPAESFEDWLEAAVRRGERLGLDPQTARCAALRHGSNLSRLHDLLAGQPALAERISPECPLVLGEIVHAARHEMARTVDDILRRRVPVAILCGQDDAALARATGLALQVLQAEPVV